MASRISVLLIDDDPAQCETLADILSDYDCDVTPCSDSVLGATLGTASRYDLVLLDLKMAGLSGVDLLRHIRATRHGCIIVLTGMVEADVKRAARIEGADAVLDKPVDIDRLLEIARDIQVTGNCKSSAVTQPAS
jgi:DNA-binding response OmpR family regulator